MFSKKLYEKRSVSSKFILPRSSTAVRVDLLQLLSLLYVQHLYVSLIQYNVIYIYYTYICTVFKNTLILYDFVCVCVSVCRIAAAPRYVT